MRVVADEIGRLLDLADRLEPALAVLERERRAVDDRALGDQVGSPVENLAPLLPRRRRPRRMGSSRLVDDIVDVVAVGQREVPDHQRGVQRRDRGERLAVAFVVADPQRMLGAQLAAHRFDSGVVGGVEFGVVGRHGGVRDTKSGHATSVPEGEPLGEPDHQECGWNEAE